MYIKFYQAYDTAKPSNVRETQYWYYDSNHKNLAKSRTIKFSNTRPSYLREGIHCGIFRRKNI